MWTAQGPNLTLQYITLTAHCLSSTRRELHIIRRITLHQFQLHNCLNLMYPNPTRFHNSWCFANRRWQIALELRHQRRNLIVCWNLCETPCFVESVSMILRKKNNCAPGSGSLAVVPTRSWRFEMHAQWNSGLKMTFVSLCLCCAMAFWQGAEVPFCIGTAASRLLFVAVCFWINHSAFCKSTLATGASKLLHRDSLVQCYICLRSSMVLGTPLPADRGRVAAYRVCRGCLRICFLFFHLLISILSQGRAVATSDHENVSVTQEMKFHRQKLKKHVILSWLLRPLHPKWSSTFKKWRKMRFWVAPQRVPRSRSPAQEELLMVTALVKITLDDGWPESSREQFTQVSVKKCHEISM